MRGTIPPLPNTPSWRCAQIKHRDNFSFTLPLLGLRMEEMASRYREKPEIYWIRSFGQSKRGGLQLGG
jgi:hypothetical protein